MVGFAPTPPGTPTVLLVSTDPRVVMLLEAARNLAPPFRLELCSDYEQVLPLLRQDDTALVVVDVPAAADHAAAKEMLWAVMQLDRPVRSLLLLDECDEKHCDEFKRAGATCCRLRAVNEQKLAHALEALTFEGRSFALDAAEAHQSNGDAPDPDPSFYICPQIEEMMKKVRRVAPQDTTLLLTGETGTGKTHLARFIHQLSPRSAESFKVVECSSLSPTL
ncbi:MAG TPA: sigma 54-interacting transcriptional regulator, partial [Gemmataceae bacterium]|nr:sigma 54-interacting transcriptional regulator [Gemmataceae bacterium]